MTKETKKQWRKESRVKLSKVGGLGFVVLVRWWAVRRKVQSWSLSSLRTTWAERLGNLQRNEAVSKNWTLDSNQLVGLKVRTWLRVSGSILTHSTRPLKTHNPLLTMIMTRTRQETGSNTRQQLCTAPRRQPSSQPAASPAAESKNNHHIQPPRSLARVHLPHPQQNPDPKQP